MPRKDITPTLLKKLYHKKLLSKKEIAQFLNCNITTVHKKMVKFGIPRRSQTEATRIAMQKKIIKIPKSKLEDLYLKKELSIHEIAKKLKHDRATIGRELKRHQIRLRTHSETTKLAKSKNKIKKSTLAKLYYKDHLTQKQIARKLGKHPRTIYRWMKEYGLETRSRSELSTRYPKSDFSGDPEEKAYLIGFKKGDLYAEPASKNLIRVASTSTKIEQIELFRNLFKKYGHIWVGESKEDGNKNFCVRLNHTFNFLLSNQDNIPKWIRENNDYFISFLAGYTDAEGCFYISKKNVASFTLASYDKNILEQIHKQLQKMGIECNPPRIKVKRGHVKSDGCVYREDHWYFTINKKSSLLVLLELLKPKIKHQKRLKDLKKAEQNIIERNKKSSSK